MLRAALSLWACAAFAVDDGWFASLRWPPQREQAALNNSHTHHAALLAELRRSLGAFEPAASRSDAKDLLRRALRDPRHRDHVVLVLDGRIFTSKAFAHVSKNAMHLRMLAAAIRRRQPSIRCVNVPAWVPPTPTVAGRMSGSSTSRIRWLLSSATITRPPSGWSATPLG